MLKLWFQEMINMVSAACLAGDKMVEKTKAIFGLLVVASLLVVAAGLAFAQSGKAAPYDDGSLDGASLQQVQQPCGCAKSACAGECGCQKGGQCSGSCGCAMKASCGTGSGCGCKAAQ